MSSPTRASDSFATPQQYVVFRDAELRLYDDVVRVKRLHLEHVECEERIRQEHQELGHAEFTYFKGLEYKLSRALHQRLMSRTTYDGFDTIELSAWFDNTAGAGDDYTRLFERGVARLARKYDVRVKAGDFGCRRAIAVLCGGGVLKINDADGDHAIMTRVLEYSLHPADHMWVEFTWSGHMI